MLFFFIPVYPYVYAAAGQTASCHCFRDRTYNPEDRFAADDYLLTTVFNSLTAGYFSIEKERIVMLKMKGGARNEDLLIGLYLSRHTGIEVSDLLNKKNNNSWRRILAEIPVSVSFREDHLYSQIMQGAADTQAADAITEKMLTARFGVTHDTINTMVQQGNSLRQIALILTLANHLHTDMETISSPYRNRGLSWSQIAHNFGLQPADVGKLAGKPNPKEQ